MKVSELLEMLKLVDDPEAHIEFHDLTYIRKCPVNSANYSLVHTPFGDKLGIVLTNVPKGRPLI